MQYKKGQFWENLIPWMISLAVLVLTLILYLGLNGKLGAIGEFIQEWLRFGR